NLSACLCGGSPVSEWHRRRNEQRRRATSGVHSRFVSTVLKWLAVAAASAYAIAMLAFHFATFPGLHGDEAWFGLFALRVRDAGLFTPSGMNWYTGSIYGWLVS